MVKYQNLADVCRARDNWIFHVEIECKGSGSPKNGGERTKKCAGWALCRDAEKAPIKLWLHRHDTTFKPSPTNSAWSPIHQERNETVDWAGMHVLAVATVLLNMHNFIQITFQKTYLLCMCADIHAGDSSKDTKFSGYRDIIICISKWHTSTKRVSIFIIATAHLIAIMFVTSCHVQNSTLAGQHIDLYYLSHIYVITYLWMLYLNYSLSCQKYRLSIEGI